MEKADLSRRSFPASGRYVKLTGRTEEQDGVRWMIHSASRAEFRMSGTEAAVTIVGDASATAGDEASCARLAVYVNGVRMADRLVRKPEERIEFFSSEEEREVTVSVVKLSEGAISVFGIRSFDVVASKDIEPLPEKELKIEFIGDSITCGYGVDDENPEHPFSTATEDATKTYAWKTAEALGADLSCVCYSGHGIISGYTDSGIKVPGQLVPPIYEKIGKNNGSAEAFVDVNRPWHFSAFVPQFVVINLGTNDDSYVKDIPNRREEYTACYAEFLKTVRKNNPRAQIVASLGVMGDGLFPCVQEAVLRYRQETGDDRITTLRFPPQDGSTGFAADWHPTEKTQEIAANILIGHLRQLQ